MNEGPANKRGGCSILFCNYICVIMVHRCRRNHHIISYQLSFPKSVFFFFVSFGFLLHWHELIDVKLALRCISGYANLTMSRSGKQGPQTERMFYYRVIFICIWRFRTGSIRSRNVLNYVGNRGPPATPSIFHLSFLANGNGS